MGSQKHLCMVLLISFVTWINAEKIMRPKIKDIKIWSDNAYGTHSVDFDPADPHINLTMTALQDLHDLDVHVEGHVVQKLNPTYFLSFNTTINLCNILNWRNNSPIGTLIHAYLKEYGNIFEDCPIVKGTYNLKMRLNRHKFQGQYYMHKFWIPEDSSTALLPEVDFEINFSAYHIDSNKKRTMIANDYFAGEAVVQDVDNVKRGIFAMLPKAG